MPAVPFYPGADSLKELPTYQTARAHTEIADQIAKLAKIFHAKTGGSFTAIFTNPKGDFVHQPLYVITYGNPIEMMFAAIAGMHDPNEVKVYPSMFTDTPDYFAGALHSIPNHTIDANKLPEKLKNIIPAIQNIYGPDITKPDTRIVPDKRARRSTTSISFDVNYVWNFIPQEIIKQTKQQMIIRREKRKGLREKAGSHEKLERLEPIKIEPDVMIPPINNFNENYVNQIKTVVSTLVNSPDYIQPQVKKESKSAKVKKEKTSVKIKKEPGTGESSSSKENKSTTLVPEFPESHRTFGVFGPNLTHFPINKDFLPMSNPFSYTLPMSYPYFSSFQNGKVKKEPEESSSIHNIHPNEKEEAVPNKRKRDLVNNTFETTKTKKRKDDSDNAKKISASSTSNLSELNTTIILPYGFRTRQRIKNSRG